MIDDTMSNAPVKVATYFYTDADFATVGTKHRWEPGLDGKRKSFTWEAGRTKTLYALPDIREAIRTGAPVWIAAGEKDADRLRMVRPDLAVTTCPDGEGSWCAEFTELLAGAREVNIVADNDDAGKRGAEKIGNALSAAYPDMLVRSWLPVPDHPTADLSDHLDAGYTVEDLILEIYWEETPEFDDLTKDEEEHFWNLRDCLARARANARAQDASPWAVEANNLARISASLPVGLFGPDGLVSNILVAIIGPPRSGKGEARKASMRALSISGERPSRPVGTGEGLASAFYRGFSAPAETNVWVTVPEGKSVAILGERAGATLLPEMRKFYDGDTLGFGNATDNSSRIVNGGSYRGAFSVDLQPKVSEYLLSHTDDGTAQRFLFAGVGDPHCEDKNYPLYAPEVFTPPWFGGVVEMTMEESVRVDIRAFKQAHIRRDWVDMPDCEDSLLSPDIGLKIKIAMLYAIRRGDSHINVEDFHIAELWLKKSTATIRKLQSVQSTRGRTSVADKLVRGLKINSTSNRREMTQRLTSRDRPYLTDALDEALADGRIVLAEGEHGAYGARYGVPGQ